SRGVCRATPCITSEYCLATSYWCWGGSFEIQIIEAFVKCLKVSEDYIDALMSGVGEAFDKQQLVVHNDAVTIDLRIAGLRSQIKQAVDKIKFLSSETTIKYMEEDIAKLEAEIGDLMVERQ